MKKLLSIATITTLLTTAISADTITLNAKMLSVANVTLQTPATLSLAGTTGFTAFNAAEVALTLTDTAQILLNEDVHLITNNHASNVSMNLTAINAMTSTSTSETIQPICSYDIGSSGTYNDITVNTAFDLTAVAATDSSDNIVGKLKCVTSNATATQAAGTYSGTIAVSIIAE